MHKHLLALALLAVGSAQAADFAIRYQGTVGASSVPGIAAGQPYAITLVLNNDDSSPNGQTWNRYHVQCVLVQTPTTGFAQPLNNMGAPTPDATGGVATDTAGVLTGVFSNISAHADGTGSSTYGHVGLGALTAPLAWAADNSGVVLADDGGLNFTNAGGRVPNAPAQWSNPDEYDGGCTASPLSAAPPPAPGATPVPTLSQWGTLLLSGLMAWGVFGLQRPSIKRKQL